MFQDEDDDVFGFKSFESTFEVENKFKILEKYSDNDFEILSHVQYDAILFYNFYSLGKGKLYIEEKGICYKGKSRLNINWKKILEMGLKKDPESEQDLLNIKLDSQVYCQFSFMDFNLFQNVVEKIQNYQPNLCNFRPKHNDLQLQETLSDTIKVDHQIQDKQLDVLQRKYDSDKKKLQDRKMLLMQEISKIDKDLLDLERNFNNRMGENMDNQCNLCFDCKVEVVFRPCGHEICIKCLENLKTHDFTVCPWDRLQVQPEIFRMF